MRGIGMLSAFALSLAFTLPVHALTRGACDTPEAISAKLKAEGQRSFATADRVERDKTLNVNVLYGMIFTVNADGSTGYILMSDKDSGTRANKICVHERMTEIQVFDARKPGLPPESLMRATDEDGKRRCDALVRDRKLDPGTCGTLNADLKAGEKHGEHVMFHGFNVSRQKDGSFAKDGTLTTVAADMSDAPMDKNDPKPKYGSVLYSILPEGATISSVSLVYARYTPYGVSLLAGR